MKYLRWTSLGIGILVALSLVYQLVFATVVRPWELNRALRQGCNIFEKVEGKSSVSAVDEMGMIGAFAKASRLDPRYLVVAQAAVMDSEGSTKMGTLATNENYKAVTLLIGFCSTGK